MKKLTILLTGLLIAAFSSTMTAQTYDVGVTDLPTVFTNMPVYPNLPIQIQYTRENFGAPVTNTVVDSFTMEIHADQIKRQTFYRNMGSPFGTGASETLGGVSNLDWGSLGISAGPVSVCAQTRLWKNGVLIDANPGNDQYCVVVNYSGDNNPFTYDIAITNVKIGDALTNYVDGDTIEPTLFMSVISFTVENKGSSGIPAGLGFSVNVKVDNAPFGPFTGSITAPIGQGGTVEYTIDALANGISLPTGKTVFDVCVTLVSTDDTNPGNDNSCSTFNVKSYTGIEDEEEVSNFDMNYFNRNLSIDLMGITAGSVDLSIMSMSGQRVYSESFYSNGNDRHEVDLSKLTSGAFIAVVATENGLTESTRFVID